MRLNDLTVFFISNVYILPAKKILVLFEKMGKWMHTQLFSDTVTQYIVFLQNKFHFEYETSVGRRLAPDMLTCLGIRNVTVTFQSDHLNHYFEYNDKWGTEN